VIRRREEIVDRMEARFIFKGCGVVENSILQAQPGRRSSALLTL